MSARRQLYDREISPRSSYRPPLSISVTIRRSDRGLVENRTLLRIGVARGRERGSMLGEKPSNSQDFARNRASMDRIDRRSVCVWRE